MPQQATKVDRRKRTSMPVSTACLPRPFHPPPLAAPDQIHTFHPGIKCWLEVTMPHTSLRPTLHNRYTALLCSPRAACLTRTHIHQVTLWASKQHAFFATIATTTHGLAPGPCKRAIPANTRDVQRPMSTVVSLAATLPCLPVVSKPCRKSVSPSHTLPVRVHQRLPPRYRHNVPPKRPPNVKRVDGRGQLLQHLVPAAAAATVACLLPPAQR